MSTSSNQHLNIREPARWIGAYAKVPARELPVTVTSGPGDLLGRENTEIRKFSRALDSLLVKIIGSGFGGKWLVSLGHLTFHRVD